MQRSSIDAGSWALIFILSVRGGSAPAQKNTGAMFDRCDFSGCAFSLSSSS